jgi:nucleoside-diphosphate-sugar epimerase
LTLDINHRGTLRLARAAREAGVERFVYFSSCSVYGDGGEAPCAEESELEPLTQYARCKVLNEIALQDLASESFSPVLLRNATVYGPSPRMRFDLLPNNLAGLAHTRGRIELISDGTPRRPLIHIEDVCLATELVLKAARQSVHNQVFNVGADEANYSVLSVAQTIAKIYPGCPVERGPASADRRSYFVSFGKIRDRLGFQPEWNLERGVVELQAIFRRSGLSAARFEAPAFNRVKQIRALRQENRLDERLFWTAA